VPSKAKATKPAAPAGGAASGPGVVQAPMPGLIVSFQVKEGDTVTEGDPLLVLEAMKMQNVINAPISGRVQSIPKPAGSSVSKDEVLCVIAAG